MGIREIMNLFLVNKHTLALTYLNLDVSEHSCAAWASFSRGSWREYFYVNCPLSASLVILWTLVSLSTTCLTEKDEKMSRGIMETSENRADVLPASLFVFVKKKRSRSHISCLPHLSTQACLSTAITLTKPRRLWAKSAAGLRSNFWRCPFHCSTQERKWERDCGSCCKKNENDLILFIIFKMNPY